MRRCLRHLALVLACASAPAFADPAATPLSSQLLRVRADGVCVRGNEIMGRGLGLLSTRLCNSLAPISPDAAAHLKRARDFALAGVVMDVPATGLLVAGIGFGAGLFPSSSDARPLLATSLLVSSFVLAIVAIYLGASADQSILRALLTYNLDVTRRFESTLIAVPQNGAPATP